MDNVSSTSSRPVNVLIAAGAVNGFILPFALTLILLAAGKQKIIGDYRHPLWLTIAGWLVVIVMSYMAITTIVNLF